MPSRKFRAEGPVLYQRYQFGYCQWAEADASGWEEELEEIYSGGYLPFSGNPGDRRHLFYMARSLRVPLDRLALDKKRRYDHRQWEKFGLQRRHWSKADFLARFGRDTAGMARTWMEARFGEAFLSGERYAYIFSKPYLQEILSWTLEERLLAFAFVVRGFWGAHYWYVFYQNDRDASLPPGHGYLIDFLYWCREQHLPYAYLGTTYGIKSRYKARGIEGVEFWDGNHWCRDRVQLDELRRQDDEK